MWGLSVRITGVSKFVIIHFEINFASVKHDGVSRGCRTTSEYYYADFGADFPSYKVQGERSICTVNPLKPLAPLME